MSRLIALRALVAAGGLLLLLLGLAAYRGLSLGRASTLDDFGEAPAFTLIDHLERPASSADLRGTVVVANFVYTNCGDICPLLSAQMQALQERFRRAGLGGDRVHLLSFTVDPARDTPAVLRTYAERFRADPQVWRFLTGPPDEVVPLIVTGFRLGVDALPPTGASPSEHGDGVEPHARYDVMHSGRFVLIDRRYRIRAYYDGRELDLDRVVEDSRELLR